MLDKFHSTILELAAARLDIQTGQFRSELLGAGPDRPQGPSASHP